MQFEVEAKFFTAGRKSEMRGFFAGSVEMTNPGGVGT
jgi:hypothetical protein